MAATMIVDESNLARNNCDTDWMQRQSKKRAISDEEDDGSTSASTAMDTSDDAGSSDDQQERSKRHCKFMLADRVVNMLMHADQNASGLQPPEDSANQKAADDANSAAHRLSEERECLNCGQIVEVNEYGEPCPDQSLIMFRCEFCTKDICGDCVLECCGCQKTYCRFCAIQQYDNQSTAICFSCQS